MRSAQNQAPPRLLTLKTKPVTLSMVVKKNSISGTNNKKNYFPLQNVFVV